MEHYLAWSPTKLFAHSIFIEAAVAVDRSQKQKRYEDYKKSQEARMYNHPGHDAQLVLVQKLQALRTSSHRESERLAQIVTDLESLPSHNLFDVVAYNEHNHLTVEGEAEEKRKASMDEAVKRWNEKRDLVDRNLLVLQGRLDELAQEKQAREAVRDLPDPVDHNKMAVEDAGTMHQANVQRVAAVEVRTCLGPSVLAAYLLNPPVALQASVQTTTLAESIPHRDGPIQTLEESLPTMDSQAPQLQEFAEGVAKLIQQVPVVREATRAIKAGNETRKRAEEVVSNVLCRS